MRKPRNCRLFHRDQSYQQRCVELSQSDCAPKTLPGLRRNCLQRHAEHCMAPALCGFNRDGTPNTNCAIYRQTIGVCKRHGYKN